MANRKKRDGKRRYFWSEPAPLEKRYPWKELTLPWIPNPIEGSRIAEEMKKKGNESFKRGDYFDALWKYEHSLNLLRALPDVDKYMAAIHSNISAACLKLGDDRRSDLLVDDFFPYNHQIMWYGFSKQHAEKALTLNPDPKIAHKSYWRRGESYRKMIAVPEMRDAMQSLLPIFPLNSNPYQDIVCDFVKCFEFQDSVESSKILCDAVIIAVDHEQTSYLPTLTERHTKNGFITQLLKDLVNHPDVSAAHIEFVILEMKMHSNVPQYDASTLSATFLLRQQMHKTKVFEKLIRCGLPVTGRDLCTAVQELPGTRAGLVKLLASSYSGEEKDLFEKALDTAEKLKKKDFLDILMEYSTGYETLKEEGNSLFSRGAYEEALGKYFQALNYCRRHHMVEEMAIVRANCAQACLKLRLFSDAYTHGVECVKLDPQNHKGYYRKAEALKSLLSSSRDYGNYSDVVRDYLKSHEIQCNLEAFSQAVVLAVEHGCTQLVPKFHRSHVKSGFSNSFLKHVFIKCTLTERLLRFVILQLPDSQIGMSTYNTSFVDLKVVVVITYDVTVIKRLLNCGMIVREDDIITITRTLPDAQIALYELILNYSACAEDKHHTCINFACQEALKAKKPKFAITLIKRGSTPPPEKIKEIPELARDPFVKSYMTTVGAALANRQYNERIQREELSPEQALKRVSELNAKAKGFFQSAEYTAAQQLFYKALIICEDFNFVVEAASVHGNLAHVLLKTRQFYEAFKHSDACVKLSPTFDKAYFRRAESLKCALKSRQYTIPPEYSFEAAIKDYKTAYEIKCEAKYLAEAVLLASEHGKLELLAFYCKNLASKHLRTKLLFEVLGRENCKEPVLKFLMLYSWETLPVDCSKVVVKTLLVDIKVKDGKLLSRFLDCGAPVAQSDIQSAIRSLSSDNIEVFKVLLSKCEKVDLNKLCYEAFEMNKPAFALHFIEQGAKLSGDVHKLLLKLLKQKNFDGAKALLKFFTEEMLMNLDLASLLETDLVHNHEMIEMLIKLGLNPNGKKPPISTVMNLPYLSVKDQIGVICLLIRCGANCNQLCKSARGNAGPVHVATELALRSDGDTRLIEAVISSPSFDKSGKHTNDKSETPIHLAVKPHLKKEISIKVVSVLIKAGLFNPSTRDKSNKQAVDYLQAKDPRLKMLEELSLNFKSKRKRKKNKADAAKQMESSDSGKKEEEETADHDKEQKQKVYPSRELPSDKKTSKKAEPSSSVATAGVKSYEKMSPIEKINYHLEKIREKDSIYFQNVEETSPDDESSAHETTSVSEPTGTPEHQERRAILQTSKSSPTIQRSPQIKTSPVQSGSLTDEAEVIKIADFGYEMNFDCLPWEVEITKNVIKFFKNEKRYSSVDRMGAVKVIYQIAEGKRNKHLSKQVGSNQKICLYEARITGASRVLWEKAISYSAKLTGKSHIPVYTQIIRVWEVVLDHDEIDRRIRYCSEQIELSYKRGFMASIRWGLKPISQDSIHSDTQVQNVRGREITELPCMYTIDAPNVKKSDHEFVPAASTNENEYNVTTFYSFDTMAAKSMVAGTNARRDYPFKEWQKEHEIIKIDSKGAILLLGRSGTGKTTCCLYRLWNEFKNYWNPESETFLWKLRRRAIISSATLNVLEDEDLSDSDESTGDSSSETEEEQLTLSLPHTKNDDGSTSDDQIEVIEEDLHQIFVTKNYVLCDQMKKRFYSMASAYDFLEPHLSFEDDPLPSSFSKFDNLAFPAFLTARQFYILLDNSLGDDNTFFKRDENGNLQVKITSLDYDHEDPDLLLDIEHSDSEDEDMDPMKPTAIDEQPSLRQHSEKWTEVTAVYFKEMIWPKISHQCGVSDKDFDPMLVWIEIQSFIKGSELTIRKNAPLNLVEYKELGNRMAPNFSSHREKIYELYKKYQRYKRNLRHSNYLFDECDLILDLHKRRKKVNDVPWSIHSIYIDEVQDFTQAELSIFIHCCRDPNSMFFTGDTAQSIMRGIAFRFQDLRSCFHRINSKIPAINVPQKPLTLKINYRSHSGILKLAGNVIDLISEFFKDSIDHLPDDEGMFPGPIPVFLDSCKEDDLSLLLSANKRECSAIEFGAHQVIIVQSKDARDRLPDILKGAIVMTVFEAKGLEFDDVLLYNFFTDSLVDEKGWRVVTSYLEIPHNQGKIENAGKVPGYNSEARSKSFDPTLHKSLNTELKYLYTAITRAKCNLWIYDSNKKVRQAMLEYWYKRNAIKIVTANDANKKQKYSLVFASNSTPEQWKAQGDNFRRKHLWEQATTCYERAGPNHEFLVKEASAYYYIQNARQQKPHLFQNAALSFLERDSLKHSVHCLNGAALCLKNSRPSRWYVPAAVIFEKLGDLMKAAQCYLKAKNFDEFARIQESRCEYDSVIRCLLGKPFMRKRDALSKVDEYERKGYKLDKRFTTSEMSFSCAKFYSERKDRNTLLEVLQYMPDREKKVKFMKEADLHREAYRHYIEHEQYENAFTLALAHGWFAEAAEKAERIGDERVEAAFILEQAKAEFLELPTDFDPKDVSPPIIAKLKKVVCLKDKLVLEAAEANLLLSVLMKASSYSTTALGLFRSQKHKAGQLEAFNQQVSWGNPSTRDILNCCYVAKKADAALSNVENDMKIDVKQAVKFYGFKLVGKVYIASEKNSRMWFDHHPKTLKKYLCEGPVHDLDGMTRFQHNVTEVIAGHFKMLGKQWLAKFDLEPKLMTNIQSFKLHAELIRHRSLNRQYTAQEISAVSLKEYIQNCVHLLELKLLKDEPTDRTDPIIAHLLAIFSPKVSLYLSPQSLDDQHLETVRRSISSRMSFEKFIKDNFRKNQEKSRESDKKEKVNEWIFAWRASCITQPDMKSLKNEINSLEKDIDQSAKKSTDRDYLPPAGYVFWKSENRYCHVVSFWLQSCIEIRENSRPLWAAKLAITHFMGNIAENKNVTISVENCVDVLSVHCTSLLAMITQSNALQNYSTVFVLPLLYKHRAQFFSDMNCRKKMQDKSLFAACISEVNSCSNLPRLFTDCKQLLIKAMGYLIGTHRRAPWFSTLKLGLRVYPNYIASKLCLILALALYGNIALLKDRNLEEFEDKILNILQKACNKNEVVPEYIKAAYDGFSKLRTVLQRDHPRYVFKLVEDLLKSAQMDSTMTRLFFKQRAKHQGHVDFVKYEQPQAKPPPIGTQLSSTLQGDQLSASSQMYVPPSGSLGTPVDIPPSLPAPIGSERHLQSTVHSQSSPHGSLLPVSPTPADSGLDPEAQPFLPGLSYSANAPPPSMQQMFTPSNQVGSGIPAVDQMKGLETALSHQFPPQTYLQSPRGLETDQLSSQTYSQSLETGLAPPSQSPRGLETGILPPQTHLQTQNYLTPSSPTPSVQARSPELGYSEHSPAGTPYTFYEDISGEIEMPPGMDIESETEEEEEENYGLTQQEQPSICIPPSLTEGDIIDWENNFCNVCGVSYQGDGEFNEMEGDGTNLEKFTTHVTGLTHSENTIAYKHFMEVIGNESEGQLTLMDRAEAMLKKCESLEKSTETEVLDRVIDNLRDSIEECNKSISKYKENNEWRNGAVAITEMFKDIDHFLKESKHEFRKVSGMKKRLNEEEDDEMEELAQYDQTPDDVTLNGPGRGEGKIRSEQEKKQSREKKRGRKNQKKRK